MKFLQKTFTTTQLKTIIILLFFSISFIIWFSMHLYNKHYASTEDAYVNADTMTIASRITGKVTKLYIKNNQYVKKGQTLFEIDPKPFSLAINLANAELKLNMVELEHVIQTEKRVSALVQKKFLPTQEGDNAKAQVKITNAKVDQAKAQVAIALLNLNYTKVVAEANGWVTNLTLTEGDIVTANQALFALVSDEGFWVDANFKETELFGIKPGQTAHIITDLYASHSFKGVVESISGGTGTAFSLLPPQNATGNWVKVTQRIPVRIRIVDNDANFPLRIGLSAKATINLNSN
jgi:membrane fusion protein, multidrug efflux system